MGDPSAEEIVNNWKALIPLFFLSVLLIGSLSYYFTFCSQEEMIASSEEQVKAKAASVSNEKEKSKSRRRRNDKVELGNDDNNQLFSSVSTNGDLDE